VELSVSAEDVLIVNGAYALLVPSVALIMLSALADTGTTKLPVKLPLVSDVTAATGVSVVELSLNVIACVGIKLIPVTLTV
jgi:hypothetical protein